MSRRYIDEHQIISKYLGDELSDREREEFEAYWAEHPEITEELEGDARLESGFAHLQKSGKLDAIIHAATPRRAVWPIALAASVVAGVSVALWMRGEDSARPVLAVSVAALNEAYAGKPLQLVELLPARGTLYDAVIELPRTPAALELHVLPEGIPKSMQYTLALVKIVANGERAALGVIGGLRPDVDGFLTLYIDSARLVPGQYELRLQAEPPTGSSAASSFLIKVDPAQ